MSAPQPLPPGDYAAPGTLRAATVYWALVPPLAVLLLRGLLQAQADPLAASLQALLPATQVGSPTEALWMAARPFVLTVLGVGAAITGAVVGLRTLRRLCGEACAQRAVLGGWLLLWALLAAWLLAAHLNRAGRVAQPEIAGRVLLVGEIRPSERDPGGADVYFETPGEAAPLQLRAPGQPANAFTPGATVRVRPETGRWWGRWGSFPDHSGADARRPAPSGHSGG